MSDATNITLSNDHQVVRALAEHWTRNFAPDGRFDAEVFLHWVDVNLPGELLRETINEVEA